MDRSYPKSTGMQGHIVLLIIFRLIIGIEAPNNTQNVVMLEEISPIEGLQVDCIKIHCTKLNVNVLRKSFTNEQNIVLKKLETIYRIREESSSSSSEKAGGKLRKNQKKYLHTMAYGTLLAFWMAIDFRICYLIASIVYEDTNNEEYKTLKEKCSLYFNEMYFAFHEFRNRFYEIRFRIVDRKEILGKDPKLDDIEGSIVNGILSLSLDFILDIDTLSKKKPDHYLPGVISWEKIQTVTKNRNHYKTNFPSVDYVRKYYMKNEVTEDLYYYLNKRVEDSLNSHAGFIYYYLNEPLLQDRKNNRFLTAYVWPVFYKPLYSTKMRMWRMLMDEFTIDSQAGTLHRINKVIEILKKYRQMHYTILYESLKKFQRELTERTSNRSTE